MAKMTELPSAWTTGHFACAMGFSLPVRPRAMIDAAKAQLSIRRITDYENSLSHLLMNASHDAQKNGIKPAVIQLVRKHNRRKSGK